MHRKMILPLIQRMPILLMIPFVIAVYSRSTNSDDPVSSHQTNSVGSRNGDVHSTTPIMIQIPLSMWDANVRENTVLKKDLAACDAGLKYLKFERNVCYAVERFGALIETMYQESKKLQDAVSKAYDLEIENRVKSLAEIVTSLAKSAVEHGQKFDVIVEWKKLKKLEIPFAALTVISQIEGRENYTNDLEKAKKLNELLTSLITAESEEEAQTVWDDAHSDWKEWANVIKVPDSSSIRIEPSPEDRRVIKKMAEVLSPEARNAWAYRTGNIREIVDYVATKKAQTTAVETETDYYKKCDCILHVRSNHHRIRPILEWMKIEWTEENGYKGFSRNTSMLEKIRTFCEEQSNLWTEAFQGPHARFIDAVPLCKLSKDEKEKHLQEWSGNDAIKAGVMRQLMSIFDRDLVREEPKKEDKFSEITADAV